MKSADVKSNIYIDYGVEHARISKYKDIFAKAYTPNLFEEVFVIKKVKNTPQWTHVISHL